MRFADLTAVTVDAFGTLLELEDPVPALARALAARGVERDAAAVKRAFGLEVAHYRPRAHLAADGRSLAELRLECTGVFLAALGTDLSAAAFVDDFVAALRFRPVAGAIGALDRLAGHVPLAVVANWDCSLASILEELGLAERFVTIVTSAEAAAPKPQPAIFRLALERLGSEPGSALHVGDEPADELGAAAAGMHFRPAPLAAAVASLS